MAWYDPTQICVLHHIIIREFRGII